MPRRYRGGSRSTRRSLAALLLMAPCGVQASPELAQSPPPDLPEPNHLRASIEMALGLGAGTLWYVLDDRNVLDWDHPSIEQRFTGEAWRFDNNGFDMNFVLHPLTGGGTQVLARGNHIGFWPSTGYTLGVSFFWEYVIEFKEKVSVNDVLVTTGGGVPIGEFFHKLGSYLHGDPEPGIGTTALQWTLGTSVALHRAIDGPLPPRGRDSLGFDAGYWHRFELAHAPTWVRSEAGGTFVMHETTARGELVSLAGYGRPGAVSRWFHEAEVSELEVSVPVSSRGAGLHIDSDLLLAGYHHQALRRGSRDGVAGHATTAGVGLGYRYRHSSAAGFDDRQGVLRMPGPEFRGWTGGDLLSAGIRVQVHPAFAGISSLSFPAWRQQRPAPRTKAIADREGYFYGFGWSASVGTVVCVGPVELAAWWRMGRFDSQEGLDRTQELVEADIDLDETLMESKLAAHIWIPATPVGVGAFHVQRRRTSFTGTQRADVKRSLQGFTGSLRF